MKIHKWTSCDRWILPSLRVSSDSIDTTICVDWWKWHIEFIFDKKVEFDKMKEE